MSQSWYKVRLAFCFICVVFFLCGISLRLVKLQILPSKQLETLSNRQFKRVLKKESLRQPLFDRNYEEMAVSIPAGSIYARPKQVTQKKKVAHALAKHLGGSFEKWYKKLSQRKPFIWVQRQVPADKAKEIGALKLKGLYVESESRRLYPNGSLASHVLGFTDLDGKGIAGIELKANENLAEDLDSSHIYRDGKGNATYIEKEENERDETPYGVRLTLDRRIQTALEEELAAALKTTGAKSVMGIVMDPFTGEIYAMGQAPTFDPGTSKSSSQHLTNQWISSLYEPGSTVKPLLAAAAIQEGRFTKNSLINCGDGKLTFGKDTIREAESDHRFGSISLEKVIQVSSNVGAARLGMSLGIDRVKGAYERFGLTSKTGILLPGETTATLRADKEWVPIFLATASFGQGIATTPLQMVSSYAPFANGGYLVKPKILIKETQVKNSEALEVRRVLSPKTVDVMREILVKVTEGKDATGLKAKIPGILVAGKTGTAQKYEPGKGYDGKKYFSSFIGFLPADKPQLLVGVMVDEPKFPYYASQVAAPLFRTVAERSLQLLDKTPRQFIKPTEEEEKPAVVNVEPPLLEHLPAPTDHGWTMPELKGLSVREAYSLLNQVHSVDESEVKFLGTGFLIRQEPEAGMKVAGNTHIKLHFAETE